MGKYNKKGLEFRPVPCVEPPNRRSYRLANGLYGVGFLHELENYISAQDYCLTLTDDLIIDLANEWGMKGPDDFKRLLDNAIFRGVFDKKIYEVHKVLTSAEIQESCYRVFIRRTFWEICPEHQLINFERCDLEMQEIESRKAISVNISKKNVNRNTNSANISPANVDISKQTTLDNTKPNKRSFDKSKDTAAPAAECKSLNDVILKWQKVMPEDVLSLAIKMAKEKARNPISYANTVLEVWADRGVKDLSGAQAHSELLYNLAKINTENNKPSRAVIHNRKYSREELEGVFVDLDAVELDDEKTIKEENKDAETNGRR